jgi:hypothetical protein
MPNSPVATSAAHSLPMPLNKHIIGGSDVATPRYGQSQVRNIASHGSLTADPWTTDASRVLRFAVSWLLGRPQVELSRGRWLRMNAIMVLICR